MPTVSSLFVYPIKSCRGLSLLQLDLDERGPLHDRRLMVIDGEGRFLTQRENPRLAQITPSFDSDTLTVSAPNAPPLRLPKHGGVRALVKIWDFQGQAEDLGDEAARWFTEVLEQSCRLVRFADDVVRPIKKRHTDRDAQVAFADGYPLLVVSLESWSELNRRLAVPVPMNRFRPNVVLRDCQPFQEDEWQTVKGPNLTLDLVKPCSRCKMTTLNAETLEYGTEPLATLAKFRRHGDGVIFGQNAVHHGPGTLRVGDGVEILSTRLAPEIRQQSRRS